MTGWRLVNVWRMAKKLGHEHIPAYRGIKWACPCGWRNTQCVRATATELTCGKCKAVSKVSQDLEIDG